ncbi:MAG: hypothetical protein PF447_06050 [Spirochaetaceae bacterium]|jgi:hypothetical protein|nr:hypothetical protein [Spirochaetaceae bacterium]
MKQDRSAFSISHLHDNDDAYWHSRTPEERLEALQLNRQVAYGESEASQGLQRVLEIIKRS